MRRESRHLLYLTGAVAWLLVSCGSPLADSSLTVIPDAPATASTPLTAGAGYGGFGPGETSLKERIADSEIIVRASVSSVKATADVAENPSIFVAYIDFHLRVHEYLKGSGPDELIAVVWAGGHFDTRQEAQDQLPSFLAQRNSRWEDRQAIIFLNDSVYYVPRTEQSGYYYLAAMDSWDDRYSLASETDKRWLPSARPPGGAGGAADSAGEFLLAEPQAQVAARGGGASGATVTLGALKELIMTVKARLNANGGSEHQKDCVRQTYLLERSEQYMDIESLGFKTYPTHTFGSGQSQGNVVWQDDTGSGYLPDKKEQVWLDNEDADLFAVTFGPTTRVDEDEDGVDDGIVYDRHVVSARPLPAGEYMFQFNDRGAFFVICEGFTFRYEWAVTVTAPAGVLHEAFFDPVTVGTAVKADSTNGVLEPVAFTDGNSASATLQSLSYEPPAGTGDGTVKLQVDPHTGLVGHVVDFIELDGSVSLSLKVADATVDAASKTLSWSVASQLWDDGDKLMLRIRRGLSAPGGVSVSLANSTFTISWSAVTGADQYRVGYRTGGTEGEWTNLEATTGTSQTFSPEGGVACGTTYEFRVQARGDGTTYAAEWSAPSEPASHTTGACNRAPVFGSATYSFSVSEDASTDAVVGTVSAADPDEGDTVAYSITAGNDDGKFSIDATGGSITVAGSLDYEAVSSYALTVEASDGKEGGAATATVEISVTNVDEGGPPAPDGLSVSLSGDTFTISWSAVTGADQYRVGYRTGGSEGEWTNLEATTGVSQTFSPGGGVACGTTYEFRVQARGDGTTYAATWGDPSGSASHTNTAGTCNSPPVFTSDTFTFTVPEDAPAWPAVHVVGTVSATDPDEGDSIAYYITAGNEAGRFNISSDHSGGLILVWGALDYETVSSYTLTVEARDGKEGGTASATVEISVTDVAE